MTVIWFIVWLIMGLPPINKGSEAWLVALIVCVVIDLIECMNAASKL